MAESTNTTIGTYITEFAKVERDIDWIAEGRTETMVVYITSGDGAKYHLLPYSLTLEH